MASSEYFPSVTSRSVIFVVDIIIFPNVIQGLVEIIFPTDLLVFTVQRNLNLISCTSSLIFPGSDITG